jgi:hypothetical protein
MQQKLFTEVSRQHRQLCAGSGRRLRLLANRNSSD